MMKALDLLTELLLTWRNAGRVRASATLPGVLARLASGELTEFPRLRAHQFHPWCMFVTQLAAITMHRASVVEPPHSEDWWREGLLALSEGAHEPWMLVVPDLTRPAFFQPPVPERSIERWSSAAAPDDIDVLVTTRNHDVKTESIRPDDVEAWTYALVTLQTMQGFPGRGYNGIARMKGGYGNRPRVGVAAGLSLHSRFLHDVQVLLDAWPSLLDRGYGADGVSLVWLEPWDGRTTLGMTQLSPHFIEVCWRIRLSDTNRGIEACYTTTSVHRCLEEIANGDVGDPWIPVARDGGGALTVGRRGFDYRLLCRLLFTGDFEPAAAQGVATSAGPAVLQLSALARGQGKTEGLHERLLPIPANVRRRLGEPEERSALSQRALLRVDRVDLMRTKVLFPALKQIALGDHVAQDQLSTRVDSMFFDHLFRTLDENDDDARLAFDGALSLLARDELERAIDGCCVPDARRLRAVSAAERVFAAGLRKHFPDIVQVSKLEEETA